ncbi:MAG TPA: hypothetical protein VGF56_01480 [Rhizomicrobium sp.]|jgi:hypothetical protein
MAIFPKIQSPCPYKGKLSDIMDGDMCRLCKRQVFDLTAMSDGARVAFIEGCEGEVCVSYKFPIRPAIAAAALVAAMAVAPTMAAACDNTEVEVVVTGGMVKPKQAEYVRTPDDSKVPEIPVVYDKKRDAKVNPGS